MANQDKDLSRVDSMEKNHQPQGRAPGGKVPILTLKGDTNPTSGGGINRSTKPSAMQGK